MAEPRVFHVYALLSPSDDLVHYVGKTKDIHQRFRSHIQGARRSAQYGYCTPNNHRERWLWELALEDTQPVLAILEEIPITARTRAAYDAANRKALALEAAWIARLKTTGHPLTNFNSDKCGNDHRLVEAAAERGRNLALSLGRES